MSSSYFYTVLRLAVDAKRGEVINVGVVLFHADDPARVITMATLNKLRAINATWDSQKLSAWGENVNAIVKSQRGMAAQLKALTSFGFCEPDAVGMFTAEDDGEVQKCLANIKATYVANKAQEEKPKRERRTRLQTALREQFSKMQVLGHDANDLANHLVVPNMPVPKQSDLKNDFVYKNGVYRITQTIDYNVAFDGIHQKLQEACVKSTAATMAAREYGEGTQQYAVLDIPEAYLEATDSHVDLLIAHGFEVFHFKDSQSMDEYLRKATPQGAGAH